MKAQSQRVAVATFLALSALVNIDPPQDAAFDGQRKTLRLLENSRPKKTQMSSGLHMELATSDFHFHPSK